MKKLREMKKNNKGFSLVELIVVIAIMVVLIAVLGSTILGYVEKSKYSKDIQALDSVKTALSTFVADADAKYPDGQQTTLAALMNSTNDPNNVIANTLSEVFTKSGEGDKATYKFINSSNAFEGITASDILVKINNGAVSITVISKAKGFNNYQAGTEKMTNAASDK